MARLLQGLRTAFQNDIPVSRAGRILGTHKIYTAALHRLKTHAWLEDVSPFGSVFRTDGCEIRCAHFDITLKFEGKALEIQSLSLNVQKRHDLRRVSGLRDW